MMWKTNRYAQASALPAIAAALALTSTPVWSQDTQPAATSSEPSVSAPASTVDPVPVSIDPVVTTTPAPEPAPVAAQPKAAASTASANRTATTAQRAPTSAKPTAARTRAPVPATASTEAAVPVAPTQPIVDARPPAAEQAAAPAPAAKPIADENAMMLGGGALALLALGGAAFAVTRRRRHEDEMVEETTDLEPMTVEPEPAPVMHEEQPAIVAPSAFAWGNAQPEADRFVEPKTGETWVERAYRGPTPDNPSLSLRKRLKRANFFDAREKQVAAGEAKPLPADARLPDNVTVPERELELA